MRPVRIDAGGGGGGAFVPGLAEPYRVIYGYSKAIAPGACPAGLLRNAPPIHATVANHNT